MLEEGQVSLFADLRWDRYFSLLDYLKESFGVVSCGNLGVVKKADCSPSWSLEWKLLPLPQVAHMVGTRCAPPTEIRDSWPRMAPGLSGPGWRDNSSLSCWVCLACRGRPGYLLTSPGKLLLAPRGVGGLALLWAQLSGHMTALRYQASQALVSCFVECVWQVLVGQGGEHALHRWQ